MARHPRKPAQRELTPKQQEVLTLSNEGLTADQAAERLGIAVSGVYNHTKRIRDRGHDVQWKPAATNGHASTTGVQAAINALAQSDDPLGISIESFQRYVTSLRDEAATKSIAIDDAEREIERLQSEIETLREERDAIAARVVVAETLSTSLDEFGSDVAASTPAAT